MLKKRSDEGAEIRALGPVNRDTRSKVKWLEKATVKVKNFEPKETHFAVYDKSMVIISLRSGSIKSDYSAIWIKSEVLAKILGDYFNVLWENA